MDRWKGRVALVTGASVGIGAAICERLCKAGMTVVGCARNVERFAALQKAVEGAEGKLVVEKCDVSVAGDVEALFSSIRQKLGRLDVCVNNAGLLHQAPLLSGSLQDFRSMLDVNVVGLCHVTQEAVKLMKECGANNGHVIHVSSMSGHRVVNNAGGHFYTATKFAVTALTEGLRNELRAEKSGIRVSSVSPGMVDTELLYNIPRDLKPSESSILEAKDVADIVEFQLSVPDRVQIHSVQLRAVDQIF